MKKQIRIASDIHLEHIKGAIPFEEIITVKPNSWTDEILILAGDIGAWSEAGHKRYFAEFITWCSDNFAEVVIIAGNHEYYYTILDDVKVALPEALMAISHNIHFLDDSSVEIDNYLFVGSTLWTDMNKDNPQTKLIVQSYMNDFRVIKREKPNESLRIFAPDDTVELNKKGKEFIFRELKNLDNDDKDIIVVTHHAPSWLSVGDKYQHLEASHGFANNGISEKLDEIPKKPILWFHGHCHTSKEYIMPGTDGKTTVICNPFGYTRKSHIGSRLILTTENKEYLPTLTIEVKTIEVV